MLCISVILSTVGHLILAILVKMFCWDNWQYSPGNCYDNINTSALYYTSMQSHSVYPGDRLTLELRYYDQRMQQLSSLFSVPYDICINGLASFSDIADYDPCMCDCSVDFYEDCCPKQKKCKTFNNTHITFPIYFAPNIATRTNCIDRDINSNITLTIHTATIYDHTVIPVQFKPCPSGFNYGPFCDDKICPHGSNCEEYYGCSCCDKTTSYHTQCFVIESESHLNCTGDQSYDGVITDSYGRVPLCGIGDDIRPNHGYCLFHYKHNNYSNIGIGPCPIGFGNSSLSEKYSTLIIQQARSGCSTSEEDSDIFLNFQSGRRAGILCGRCSNGGIPISDVTLLPCMNWSSVYEDVGVSVLTWYHVLIIEFIPLTIMIVIIIVLDIKLVGGHITGYVLYCQIMSLQIASVNEIHLSMHIFLQNSIPFLPIWNLDFMDPLVIIHITHTMDALGAISFWYIIAFYPLVLLLLLYIWIVMYERGWRMVVCITRPVHHLLARFWLKFDIHPSLIDSIAGIYTLCFAQLSVISLKILQYAKWESLTSDESGLAFYYDGSLPYFGWPYHCLAGSFAIFVLIAFVAIPTIYLLLYPFKLFQKFLDVFKIRQQLTDAIVDSLTGSFKNGLDNNYDFRFFAGLYLLLRVGIICLHYIPDSNYFIYSYIGLLVLAGGTVSIFCPFKRSIHNFSNFLLIMFLTVLALMEIIHGILDQLVMILPIVFNLPGLVVFGYCIYKIIKACCCKCKCRRHNAPAIDDDEHSPLIQQQPNINFSINDNFDADRMMNPDNYDECHFSNPWLQAQPGSNATGGSVQGGTNSGHSVLCQPTADEDHSSCSTEGDEDD